VGQFHIDPECDQLMQKLADALTSFERQTGRQNVLVFIPCSPDEKIVTLLNGKVGEGDYTVALNWAFYSRQKG